MSRLLISAVLVAAFLIILCAILPFANANDTLTLQVNVSGDTVSIDVPDSLYLGEVARGFETNESIKISITNKGNTKVSITPEIIGTNDLFSHVYMRRIQSDSYKKIGDFSMNISKPSTLGGSNSENCYIKLDLSDYTGSLEPGINTKNANIKFVAVSV